MVLYKIMMHSFYTCNGIFHTSIISGSLILPNISRKVNLKCWLDVSCIYIHTISVISFILPLLQWWMSMTSFKLFMSESNYWPSHLQNAVNSPTKQRDFGGLDHGDDQAALLNATCKSLAQIVQDDSFREFEFRQYLFACQSKVSAWSEKVLFYLLLPSTA